MYVCMYELRISMHACILSLLLNADVNIYFDFPTMVEYNLEM